MGNVVAMMIAGSLLLAASANAVEFDGTGDWPTGGDVTLTQSVVVDDAHVLSVAGWDNLTLNAGVRMTFANTGVPATLKANVTSSGAGVIAADNSYGLVILGDNSAMSARSYFTFTNSAVCVSNEFGLGASTTGTSHPLGTSVKGAMIHFGANSSLHFGLADRKAFTNHCAITFNCDQNVTTMVFGSDANDEYFVQDGDFLHFQVNNNRKLYFRNNFEMISGRFPLRTRRGGSLYIYTVGNGAVVRFSGATVVDASGGNATLRDGIYWLGGGTVWFEQAQAPVFDTFANHSGCINVGSDDAFTGVRQLVGYYIETDLSNPSRCFDLHGHDISVGTLTSAYLQEPKETSTGFHVIRSSDPATVTISGYSTTSYDKIHAFAFSGKTSLEMNDPISTNTFCTVVSDSSGDLTVSAGTLAFKWNAGWSGMNVTVRGTGILEVNSGHAFTNGTQRLVVEDAGVLRLKTGGVACFATATIGGKTLDQGSYSVATLKADSDIADHIDGDSAAVLIVEGEKVVWNGWPDEPGATAVVPRDMTVTITDEDVEKVSRLGGIELGLNSTVNCVNSENYLTLVAPVSGCGEFRIVDSAGVTLLGDNSGLIAPGAFYVENSALAVSNRFGLGCADTGAAEIRFSSLDKRLVFGLADSQYCTNDVALKLSATVGGNVAWIGTDSSDSHFIQNADVTLTGFSTYANRISYGGNVEFASGTFKTEGSLYFSGSLHASIGFGSECSVTNPSAVAASLAFYGAGWNVGMEAVSRVFFGPKTLAGFAYFFNSTSYVKFTGENLFAESPGLALQYNTSQLAQKGRGVYEFCGNDQVIGKFSNYASTSHNKSFLAVTSDAPAIVTLETTNEALVRDSLEYQGSIGYHYAGAGTNLLCNMASTSVGDFRISSGVAGFDWGATWGGTNIAVEGSGTLYVGADSAAAGVFGTELGATRSAAVLTVSANGRLALEGNETVVFNASKANAPLDRGVYCAEDNATAKASGAVGVDWISGAGTLRVLKGPSRGFILSIR